MRAKGAVKPLERKVKILMRSQLSWIEHVPSKHRVRGSNPLGRAKLQLGVAQPGSATALGAVGREFESLHRDQIRALQAS